VFRSQGVGEALATRSLEAAKAAGAKLAILSSTTNPIARAWVSSARRRVASFCPARSIRRLLDCELQPGAFEG
jgi:hypothetical protein